MSMEVTLVSIKMTTIPVRIVRSMANRPGSLPGKGMVLVMGARGCTRVRGVDRSNSLSRNGLRGDQGI
jgi:hypothetical protein